MNCAVSVLIVVSKGEGVCHASCKRTSGTNIPICVASKKYEPVPGEGTIRRGDYLHQGSPSQPRSWPPNSFACMARKHSLDAIPKDVIWISGLRIFCFEKRCPHLVYNSPWPDRFYLYLTFTSARSFMNSTVPDPGLTASLAPVDPPSMPKLRIPHMKTWNFHSTNWGYMLYWLKALLLLRVQIFLGIKQSISSEAVIYDVRKIS